MFAYNKNTTEEFGLADLKLRTSLRVQAGLNIKKCRLELGSSSKSQAKSSSSQLKNKINQLTDDKKYSQEIENLWKDFKQLFDKKTGLNPDFSFSEMVIEIRQLLGDGKGVATKNFYQRKTNPRRKTIEAIQEWVNKEKKKEVESEDYEDDENEENMNINNNIIDNSNNSSSNSES